MTDPEWELVKRLYVFEPSERMSLADAVQRIKELTDDEQTCELEERFQEWRAQNAGAKLADLKQPLNRRATVSFTHQFVA